MRKAQESRIFGVLDSKYLHIPDVGSDLCFKVVISTLLGYGHTLLPSKRSLVPGLRKLISWSDIPNIGSVLAQLNNTGGLNNSILLYSAALRRKFSRGNFSLLEVLGWKMTPTCLQGRL